MKKEREFSVGKFFINRGVSDPSKVFKFEHTSQNFLEISSNKKDAPVVMSVDNASELITVQNLQVNGSLSFAGSDGFMMDGEDVNNSNVITEFLQVNHAPTDYVGGNNFSNAHVLIGETDSGLAFDRREITSKGDDFYIRTSDVQALRLGANQNSDSLVILPNENVGIGTTTPEAKFHISGTTSISNDNNMNQSVLLVGDTSDGIGLDQNQITKKNGSLYITTAGAGDIYFKANGLNTARITDAGSFYIYNPNYSGDTFGPNSYWKVVYGNDGKYNWYHRTVEPNGNEAAERWIAYLDPVGVGEGDQTGLNFTGQHRCRTTKSETVADFENRIGMIVASTGQYRNFDTDENVTRPNINQALPRIRLTNKRNQKNVFGVVSGAEEKNNRAYSSGRFVSSFEMPEGDERVFVNSVGEGGIWVVNINGPLENGDYITTCEISGYGMRQDDDILHNYTVAKITQPCKFALNSPNYKCITIEHNGQQYLAAFVGCTYHCG